MGNKSATVYGIDLGTTYSCIAVVDEYGKPVVIKNYDGDNITPSVVQFDGANRVVGKEAKNVAQMYHDTTVEMVKRRMGDPNWRFQYEGVDYRPEEISSYILRKLVSDAEQSVGTKITDVVITCPAYFSINEREATATAGKIAGLNVRGIINEPTAAAIAYGVQQDKDLIAFVYDLGGGTFDVTMIAIKSGEIEVIATDGDHDLGGRNWDEMIVNFLADQWKQETGSQDDPMDDPETAQDLFLKAEAAKKTLSSRDRTEVPVTHRGQRVKVTLTREKFDDLTRSLLERATLLARQTLEAAKAKGYLRFDQLLLVGGSTRMRQVSEQLRNEFGMEPQMVDPDEIVAKGAAIYGMKLALGEEIRVKLEGWGVNDARAAPAEVVRKAEEQVASERGLSLPSFKKMNLEIKNITSHSMGVEVVQPATGKTMVSNLILVNDRVPASVTKKFGTLEANQESAEIRVMENGSGEPTADLAVSKEIGVATLPLPLGLPADAPIEITLTLSAEGRLHVTGRDMTGGGAIEGDFDTASVISKEETAEAVSRSKQLTVS
jgi:molecular chaperone DnaK (HSP70)